jgi:ring-1,2-phenylacetyl-CoA epoxidase subunit PaaD
MVSTKQIYHILSTIADPEVPVLNILDLGIVRNVLVDENEQSVKIYITPTYSGCPAMDLIAMQIKMALMGNDIKNIQIINQLSPAWTTDWMTEEGKVKLQQYGIAPPVQKSSNALGLFQQHDVSCPRCGSINTQLVSQFGATACKSHYRCLDCKEPFEHFKCH